MLANVLVKTLRDQGRTLLAWAVSLALIVAMYAAVWPAVQSQPSISGFIDQMPEAFRSLFATSSADLSTPTGYIQVELMSFMGPIAVLIYAVSAGAGAIGGEEDRHTMDLLLSNPVGRGRVVVDKFLAMALGTFLLAAVMGVSLVLEGSLVDMVLPADISPPVVSPRVHRGLFESEWPGEATWLYTGQHFQSGCPTAAGRAGHRWRAETRRLR
ncbi:ABC transporter permease subunit [Pseudarthrobacter sp. fls2-241-R2A-127]|uniref:ABC transporter permease subunit n=1 Tax=Pseudarthrobacter sp. fls2-241-R2A-127 TaxID=3040303 RepID=UPI0025579FA9|nr:ABC transporter permease subunit [Pseudarthrobacter sp. fls2-241-R2A-127]